MLVALVAGCLLFLIVGYLLGKRIKNKPLEDDSVDTPGYQIAERALDTVPMGVVIADKKGEIVFRNNTADALIDSWENGVIGHKVRECLHAAIKENQNSEQVRTPGPPQRTIEITTHQLNELDEVIGSIAVLSDVTEQNRIETVRSDFVANVSHELKTPIGAVSLLAETLTQESDPEVIARLSKRLEAESQRLGRIVNDILDLSRIEGQLLDDRTAIDLEEIVGEVVDRLSTVADNRRVRIQTQTASTFISGDRLQFISLVHNLIENAVKYSEDNGEVKVTLEYINDEKPLVKLQVQDTGIGIPEREQERIFERFYRVDRARSRQSGGTGLGLSIVRNVAIQHGGTVEVHSVEHEGTTVTVHIPAQTLKEKERAEHG